jgi:uncharacterized membrane protein
MSPDPSAENLRSAKRPLSVVAGPYGHPFHPVVIPLPIGAWILSVVLDIASQTVDDGGALARAAWWAIGIGIIGAVVAAGLGLLDLTRLARGSQAQRTALRHAGLNVAVTVLFVASFAWRMDRGVALETSWIQIGLSVVALVGLGAAGWLGGKLTYAYGVRVADESDQVAAHDPESGR